MGVGISSVSVSVSYRYLGALATLAALAALAFKPEFTWVRIYVTALLYLIDVGGLLSG